jgi:hypothetical protein
LGTILRHPPVKYFCAILYADAEALSSACLALEGAFGRVDSRSQPMPFPHTDYYRAEMGEVRRLFVAFEPLAPAEALPDAKHRTNEIEERHRDVHGGRRVNLDAGYLAPAKVVLATTKDHCHRIYLGRGVYAELEYWYRAGDFHDLPWTYPDYRQECYREVFRQLRKTYMAQLKAAGVPGRAY